MTPSPPPSTLSADSRTLLLIEEDLPMRESLGEMLAFSGFQVEEVECVSDALKHLREQSVDVLVIDCDPGGAEMVDAIAQLSAEFPTLPMVVMGGERDGATVGCAMGSAACLPKPLSPKDLLAAIHAALAPQG